MATALQRTEAFCNRFELSIPILLAPMAGACHPDLSIAVANAGGLGSCGVLLMTPEEIKTWVAEFRAFSSRPFQLNTWIPDPQPIRDVGHERSIRAFLRNWGPEVAEDAGDAPSPDFAAQCETMLALRPPVISSVMGLYADPFIRQMKSSNIAWFANVSTVKEAVAAEEKGADVVVAQGAEAGGHRGCFNAEDAKSGMVGLFSLLPAVVDAVRIPVVATGGIADARGVAAALMLGASAVQIGTGFLRTPEARINEAWANALANISPEDTRVSRVFSGRAGRSIATDYVKAATRDDAPSPAPYPVQRALTAAMRMTAARANDVQRMQVWAGQSARLARTDNAAKIARDIWQGAQALLEQGLSARDV